MRVHFAIAACWALGQGCGSSNSPSPSPQLSPVEAAIDSAIAASGDPEVMRRLNPTSVVGRRLSRLVHLPRVSGKLAKKDVQDLTDAYMADFKKDESTAFAVTKTIISRLPEDRFAPERLSAYHIIRALPNSGHELSRLLYEELTTRAPAARPTFESAKGEPTVERKVFSWSHEHILAVWAYANYLQHTSDALGQTMDRTLQILAAQNDPAIREGIVQTFLSVEPNARHHLYSRIAEAKIAVGYVKPAGRSTALRVSVAPRLGP
jgi:hypothetical protein